MPWNESRRPDHDPMITTAAWRQLRKQWMSRRLPCSRCGGPIDYAGGRFLPSGEINRASFVLGHIVSRREARARGWTEAMINDSSNLQAEHLGCSNSSGAQLGRALQPTTNGSNGSRAPAPRVNPRVDPVKDTQAKARWDEWERWAIQQYGVVKNPPARW